MKRWVGSLACVAITVSCSGAEAQAVPGPAGPGRIDQRFAPVPLPQSTPEVVIPRTQGVLPPEEAAAIRFVLTGVEVSGAHALPQSIIAALYQPFVGAEISLADAYRLRDALTAAYRRAGYVLSQAIVPPQNIKDGRLRLEVVEGYISRVVVQGDVRDRRGLIRRTAERILSSRPLRERDLERTSLLIGDLPGVSVHSVVRPSPDQPGAAELVVVVDRSGLAGQSEVDNRGSRAIGPTELSANLTLNSALGLDEQTSLLVATAARTRELHYIALHHDEILNPDGWRISLSGSLSASRPGGTIAVLDARGTSKSVSVFLYDPVIRSRARTLRLGVGFTAMDTTTDLLSTRFADDRVRFATVTASYDTADALLGGFASTLVQGEIDHGFKGLGASRNGSATLSRANGRSDFTLITAQATRIQDLVPRWSIALALSGQLALDPLLTSQQFGVGGRRFGRGYEPSELTGDSGAALSIEPRFDLSFQGLARDAQLYGYYEAGEVWQKSPLAGQAKQASLASAGIGLRFRFGPHISASFELAKPLTRPVASRGDKDIRPLFDLSTTF